MLDLMLTVLAVGPMVLALLAAVAPPKAAWIRPALLPAVLMQLVLAGALAVNQFLFGFLAGGEAPRALTEAEIQTYIQSTVGFGLPLTMAGFAGITALAAGVAFARTRGAKQGLPWLAVGVGGLLMDRALSSVVQVVSNRPQGGGVDLVALIDAVQEAREPWLLPTMAAFLLAFPLFTWVAWWGRARWTEGLLPGLLVPLVGIGALVASGSYQLGVWVGKERLEDDQRPLVTEMAYEFMTSGALLGIAAAIMAFLAIGKLLVARQQRVRSGRALVRGLAWLPLAWATYAGSALIQGPFFALSALGWAMAAGEELPVSAEFLEVESLLDLWLPQAASAAVLGLALITAAGPLRSDRPRHPAGRPSAAA